MRTYAVNITAGQSQRLTVAGDFWYLKEADAQVQIQVDDNDILEKLILNSSVEYEAPFKNIRIINPGLTPANVVMVVGFGRYAVAPTVAINDDFGYQRTARSGPITRFPYRVLQLVNANTVDAFVTNRSQYPIQFFDYSNDFAVSRVLLYDEAQRLEYASPQYNYLWVQASDRVNRHRIISTSVNAYYSYAIVFRVRL